MPLCEGCGSSFEDKFMFCPYCGRSKPEMKKLQVEVDFTHKAALDDCPICGDGAKVQKVSAIVDFGTSEGNGNSIITEKGRITDSASGKQVGESFSTGTVYSSTIQQNKLAKVLAKPYPPEKPSSNRWSAGRGTFIILGIILVFIIGGIGSAMDIHTFGGAVLLLFIGAVVLVVAALGVESIVNNLNHSSDKYKEEVDQYQKELISYNAAQSIWNHLFYCHKHDIVFVLGNKEYASKEDMWKACLTWSSNKEP